VPAQGGNLTFDVGGSGSASSKPGRSNARCGEGTNKQHVPSPKVIDHRLAGSAPARAGKGVAARESDVLPDFHAVEAGVPVRVELVFNLGPVMGGAMDWCVFVQSLRILRRWSSPNPRLAKAALRRSSARAPPSWRNAAPLVAAACSETMQTTMFATSSTVAKRFSNELGRMSARKERSISSSVRLWRNIERGFAGDEDDATPAARQHFFGKLMAAQADAAHDVHVEDPAPGASLMSSSALPLRRWRCAPCRRMRPFADRPVPPSSSS
jgi:hypothetical protein